MKENNRYQAIKLIKKWEIFSIYFYAILIGAWVLFKWFIVMVWSSVYRSSEDQATSRKLQQSNKVSSRHQVHEKPPSFLVDNYYGRHLYIKLMGTKFHYVESGNKNDPVILLLHGFPDCWISWRYQINELSRFYRVIALDLKGFNDSDKPIWRNEYNPQKLCMELVSFIQALNVNSVTLMGHDFGAILGWILIQTNPEIVNKFVCISAPHPNLYWNLNSNSKVNVLNPSWMKFIQIPNVAEQEIMRNKGKFLENCLPHLKKNTQLTGKESVGFKYYDNQTVMEAYEYIFSRKSDWSGPLNYYRNLPFYQMQDSSFLISQPCLIVSGNEDPMYPLETIINSTEYCDNFVVKIIEGAHHYPHQEMPEQFNKVILKYLVGKRANPSFDLNNYSSTNHSNNSSKSLMGKMMGAVSNSVNKIHNSVQLKTNET